MTHEESDKIHVGPQVSVSSLIEALPDALIVVDSKGIILLVNMQAEWLFGRPRDELIGSPVESYIPERLRVAHVQHRAEYNAEPKVRLMGSERTLLLLQKSGAEITVDISISPMMTASGMLVLAVIRRTAPTKPGKSS